LDEEEVSGSTSLRPPPIGGKAPDLDDDDDDDVSGSMSLRPPPIGGKAPDFEEIEVSGTVPAPRNDEEVLVEADADAAGSDRADWHMRAAAKAKAHIDFMVRFVERNARWAV
jgi:hypothetical protein